MLGRGRAGDSEVLFYLFALFCFVLFVLVRDNFGLLKISLKIKVMCKARTQKN